MGITERKQRERTQMKQAILKTATDMYLKQGFENLSIRAIANRMEYSVGTMYLYYKSKAELTNALMEEGYKKLIEAFATITPDLRPLYHLRQIMHKYLEFAFRNPEYYELMFIMTKPSGISMEEKDWQSGLASFDVLKNCVAKCIGEHLIKYEDNRIASLHIWSFLHGLASLYLKKHLIPVGKPDADFIKNSVDLFANAISV